MGFTKPRRQFPIIQFTLALGLTMICAAVWLQVVAR